MKQVSTSNFGLLIANVVPGFATLWGASYFSETVRVWLGSSPVNAPTVGGFLYVTIASVALGLTVSSVRWLIIDAIHHRTGIREPQWDFSRLQENITAYRTLVEIHYHFFLFYSNMVVALAFVYCARRFSLGFFSSPLGWPDLAFLLVGIVYFVTSRDNLRKYYTRVAMLLGTETRKTDALAVQSENNFEDRVLNSKLPLRRLNAVSVTRDQQVSQINRRTIRQETVAEKLP